MSTTGLPIACTLPENEKAERRDQIDTNISSAVESIIELEDGYEFRFSKGDGVMQNIFQFVEQERRCCRFLTFELIFEPDEGPVTLRLRGPEGAKEFIQSMI
jgi:hypothetical protein